MKSYLDLIRDVIQRGEEAVDARTNVTTLSTFGRSLDINLRWGYPLLTTKRMHFKSIKAELIWFLKGCPNIKFLHDRGCTIWDEWADANGEVGPMYGKQWIDWNGHNQLQECIDALKHGSTSRRLVVSSWNVDDLDKMALSPCHILFQFYTRKGNLSCAVYQRSVDCFLGLPFDIASYALLVNMIAKQCNLQPDRLIYFMGDTHIYINHYMQVLTQLKREPLDTPIIKLNPDITNIFDYDVDDIELEGYMSWPAIKADVVV